MKRKQPLAFKTITIKVVDKDQLWVALGVRVMQARKDANITQEQLSQMIGYRRTSLANLEAGRQRCPLDTLYDIAACCGIPIEQLLP